MFLDLFGYCRGAHNRQRICETRDPHQWICKGSKPQCKATQSSRYVLSTNKDVTFGVYTGSSKSSAERYAVSYRSFDSHNSEEVSISFCRFDILIYFYYFFIMLFSFDSHNSEEVVISFM